MVEVIAIRVKIRKEVRLTYLFELRVTTCYSPITLVIDNLYSELLSSPSAALKITYQMALAFTAHAHGVIEENV